MDGQQRLTTLFLLHWYLAYKTDKHETFRIHLSGKDEKVRFQYETRDSAKEFCKNMIQKGIENSNPDKAISWNVKNQNWFLTMWTEDPTVQGMLTMLDDIDAKFKGNNSENLNSYWKKLTKDDGYIRFYVLPFDENYSLGEDLYIKMNARGLALTTFENFKASFEEELLSQNDKKTFIESIDSLWTNMFWYPMTPENGAPPTKVDSEMMRFIRMLLSLEYARRKDSSSDEEGKLFDEKIFGSLLVNAKGKDFIPDDEQNYAYLIERDILDNDTAKSIVNGFQTIGKYWDNNNHKWTEELAPIKMDDIWKDFCKKPDYRIQLLIWAIIIAPTINKKSWFRLCRNLIYNTIINDKKDMRWLIKKLYELKDKTNFGLE